MRKSLIAVALAIAAGYHWSAPGRVNLVSPLAQAVTFSADDTSLSVQPVQKDVSHLQLAFDFNNYHIRALASFEARARVLGRKDYSHGREAELSPVDLALGWGPMSRDEVLEHIDISQRGRFYFWRVEEYPIPREQIVIHSANMHLIPGNDEVKRQLRTIDTGDNIRFSGYLVRIDADDGWRWQSSLSRSDSGAGACEIVLVESISDG